MTNAHHPPKDDFPPLEAASSEGLLAVGGDLSPERLVRAYSQGIFPWFNPGQPILWWSPDPRCVLHPAEFRASRSLRKSLRNRGFRLSMDQAFGQVIRACSVPRRGQADGGTWITSDMRGAYCRLHELGIAHSVETWRGDELVGGLYGVALGGVFFGESMFSHASDASKLALYALTRSLLEWEFSLIDCQVSSDHLFSLGAIEIPRPRFAAEIARGLRLPGRPGRWDLERWLPPGERSGPV
ncbi:MAG: leucyl/phenylalanyl-tRNA--protein transferase [Pseudomonadota bacterium]|nr:leucyl/phenylalanyl-tRNA--protein transferase [Pseudomonadota bacterium]